MKKELAIASVSTAIVGGLAVFAGTVTAQTDYTDAGMSITAPSSHATVGKTFKITGYMQSACALSDTVYLEDNVNSGSTNFRKPYDPKASHSYSIKANPIVSGNTFTYTVDLSKAFWNTESDLLPQVPQAGQAVVYVSTDYSSNQTCYGSANQDVTIEYPTVVNPTQAEKPKPVPSAIAQAIAPSPSPSPSVAPVMATPAVAAEKTEIDPWLVLVLGAFLGAALISLAEVSAIEYKKKHGLKGDITKAKKK